MTWGGVIDLTETDECIILAPDKATASHSDHRNNEYSERVTGGSLESSHYRVRASCSTLGIEHLAQEHFGCDGGYAVSCCP